MEFIDLKSQQKLIREKIDHNIAKVLNHGGYILGPEVEELEGKLASFSGVKYCIGVSSGTDALLLALMALGVKAGDEVITTAFSFVATVEVIFLLGAKPVFVDIDPRTYNIDAHLIEEKITKKTKVIIPVSLYGQCADFEKINLIAEKNNLSVIEDGAQSFGAEYKGQKSCSISKIGITSFFPSKPLGGYGDSGACFTNDDDLALKIRQISQHGQDRRYHHKYIGINGRMDTIQAAILLAKLDIFPGEIKLRQMVANKYNELLNDRFITPFIETNNTSVYAQYTILTEDRKKVQKALIAQNIPTAVHYPVPLNQQPIFKQKVNLPITERISKQVISLPMHPYLKESEQILISDLLK
jgi:UDP-2-acetamido-2-deoxy-ribo-hexuluronate aminotransferase